MFVRLGNANIELIQPLGDNSPISKFIESNKNGGLHHLCVEVSIYILLISGFYLPYTGFKVIACIQFN
ncbi:hypothetical protein Smp_185850 [Schistosoma mansoni]|uniref:hypothetical protein n=1 Tax=Schistosoma mansoni TaxID=6183 RepID=UPI00022DC821|nr:hypothetical protein Smp_185850 [Schistosoma mansoni]|eukprot:XP_018651539.1 hypothetical protein Smp_185850 [Schistosoma mansoni]